MCIDFEGACFVRIAPSLYLSPLAHPTSTVSIGVSSSICIPLGIFCAQGQFCLFGQWAEREKQMPFDLSVKKIGVLLTAPRPSSELETLNCVRFLVQPRRALHKRVNSLWIGVGTSQLSRSSSGKTLHVHVQAYRGNAFSSLGNLGMRRSSPLYCEDILLVLVLHAGLNNLHWKGNILSTSLPSFTMLGL